MARRVLWGILALGTALASASGARAQAVAPDAGFNADSVAQWIAQHKDAAPSPVSRLTDAQRAAVGRLMSAAEGFRRLAVTDLPGLHISINPEGNAQVANLFGGETESRQAHLWQFFLEDSLTYVGDALAATPRVGYYNPLIDGWLVADWRQRTEGQTVHTDLVSLRAVTGETLRGAAAGVNLVAYWTEAKNTSLLTALATSHRAAVADFESRFPMFGAAVPVPVPNDQGLVELRLTESAASLAALNASAPYRDAVAQLRKAIAGGDPAALRALFAVSPAPPVEPIAGLSSFIRGALRPNAVLRLKEDVAVLMGVPFSGRWVLEADYAADAKGGPAPLQSLGLIDLGLAEAR